MSKTSRRQEEDSDAVFADLFERYHRVILAYTLRRTSHIADAEDAAAETFAVAWRRIADRPDAPLPWLYGIARRVLSNQRRSGDRRMALLLRLHGQQVDVSTPSVAGGSGPALVALGYLRPDDQELLRLVVWEELDHAEIAIVFGISVNAVAIRLHRARGRFAQAFAASSVKGSGQARTSTEMKGRASGRDRREDME